MRVRRWQKPDRALRGTSGETGWRGRAHAKRSPGGMRSSVCGPAIIRRRARRNVRARDATAVHSTLSADTTHIRVFYPFHPLHGYSLRVIRRPKRGDGAISVIDPAGRRPKIPVWMICSDAADIGVIWVGRKSKSPTAMSAPVQRSAPFVGRDLSASSAQWL